MSDHNYFSCFRADCTTSRFVPRYFEKNIDSGVPVLTLEGREAVEEELAESSQYCLEDHEGAIINGAE